VLSEPTNGWEVFCDFIFKTPVFQFRMLTADAVAGSSRARLIDLVQRREMMMRGEMYLMVEKGSLWRGTSTVTIVLPAPGGG
jgi:hypothetical protein